MSTTETLKPYPLLHPGESARDLDPNSPKAKMLQWITSGQTCLEVGCGAGSFSRLLAERGLQVTGLEINPVMAEAARAYCQTVHVADLNRTDLREIFPGRRFDWVVFGDVLEHTVSPGRILEAARACLSPGGAVIASIPNIAHGAVRLALLQGDFTYTRYGILDDTHLRFFTRKTVFALFEEAGYVVTHLDRTFLAIQPASSLVPPYRKTWLTRSLGRMMRTDLEANTLQFVIRAVPRPDDPTHTLPLQDDSEQSFRAWHRKHP